jgi:hypothetical protein
MIDFGRDLSRAQAHLDNMADASAFDEYAHEWQEFLYQLERVWERAFQAHRSEPGFQALYQNIRKLQKGDPLLKYLKHARNAETHTLQGTLTSSLNIAVREKFGRSFQLSRIETSLVGGCLTIDLKSPDILREFEADVSRSAPALARFRDRGKWYNPPRTHLGSRLSTQNPVVVGKIGLDFCRAFVHEAAGNREKQHASNKATEKHWQTVSAPKSSKSR